MSSDRFPASNTVLAAEKVIAPICAELGCELLGCEMTGDPRGKPVLRLFVDKEGGTGIDDCVRVHHAVTDVLDAEGLFPGAWVLEVSSPGLDRPMFRHSHVVAAVGKLVKIKLSVGLDGRKRMTGILQRVDEREAEVLTDDGLRLVFPLDDIEKAHEVWDGDKEP